MRPMRVIPYSVPLVLLLCGCDDGPDISRPDEVSFDFQSLEALNDISVEPRVGIAGSGNVVTQSREVSGFEAVSFSGVGRLILEQTGTESLTITADDNVLPLIVSDVVGRRLVLGFQSDTNFTNIQEIVFRLSVRRLEELSVSGAVSVDASGIDMDALSVSMLGASTVTTAGRSTHQEIVVSGASTYDASGLASRSVTVDASGASRVVVRVSETLHARVSGGSLVEYIGDPVVTIDGPSHAVVRR